MKIHLSFCHATDFKSPASTSHSHPGSANPWHRGKSGGGHSISDKEKSSSGVKNKKRLWTLSPATSRSISSKSSCAHVIRMCLARCPIKTSYVLGNVISTVGY